MCDDDNFFATTGKQSMRGALARSLSVVASSPQQVGSALTQNSGEGSSKGVEREGSKGVNGRDVAVEDWVKEVVN